MKKLCCCNSAHAARAKQLDFRQHIILNIIFPHFVHPFAALYFHSLFDIISPTLSYIFKTLYCIFIYEILSNFYFVQYFFHKNTVVKFHAFILEFITNIEKNFSQHRLNQLNILTSWI